ncbi:MAG TPA: hypothetical protein VJ695_03290 [Nitrososphaera sp.]|nr:hypothetical protein [Nitrososphaera sp.]
MTFGHSGRREALGKWKFGLFCGDWFVKSKLAFLCLELLSRLPIAVLQR